MSDFSFKRDFKSIMWKETLQVNFFRALFAGPVLMILMTLTGMKLSESLVYLLLPVGYFVVLVPFGLVCFMLSDLGVPFIGWLGLILSLMVAVGDPFVSILKRYKPNLIPVEEFGIFNLRLIIFALNNVNEERETAIAGE